jgi:XXXCH domain-containing protein
MLESKKKMAQGYSDLKVALEKGKGSVEAIFPVFEKGCRDFAQETKKVPPEFLKQFLDQVQRLKEKIAQGNVSGMFEQMDEIKKLKKSCHDKYK